MTEYINIVVVVRRRPSSSVVVRRRPSSSTKRKVLKAHRLRNQAWFDLAALWGAQT